MTAPLLYLVHRLPYPPNKGDKIRSYHWLRHLAERYRVFLGTFVDSEEDWQHLRHIRRLCADICVRPLRAPRTLLRMAGGLIGGRSLSVSCYDDRALRAWVREVVAREQIDNVLVFSSTMAQYVLQSEQRPARVVADLVDVDSYKWRQYSTRHHWPMSWIYRRESQSLLEYETELIRRFDRLVFVTEQEVELFRGLTSADDPRIVAIGNGVDTDYFSPDRVYADPYQGDERVLVFTGAMDYWANVDGVQWFAHEVFPKIRAIVADAKFFIVGARPTEAVRGLRDIDGVHVTGSVPDIRPYLAHAKAAVVPLRIARGIQNKVLEAMSMAVPLVATPAAIDGIDIPGDMPCRISNEADELAGHCIDLLAEASPDREARGRAWVLRRYQWSERANQLMAHIEGDVPTYGPRLDRETAHGS